VWNALTARVLHEFEAPGGIISLAFSSDGKSLASGASDGTALIWNAAGWSKVRKLSTPSLSSEQLESLWGALAGEDGTKAYRAIGTLAAAPKDALPFLQKRIRPASPVDTKRIARLIAELDSDDFAVRERATSGLEKLGGQAGPALRKALDGRPSAEARLRLER